ncbi:MAG: hypothetical protein M0R16_08875 [Bacteroidales bacterium]|jgi:hypothetical protein|nr:hypothetical protein [Bacteroidales bacterium]
MKRIYLITLLFIAIIAVITACKKDDVLPDEKETGKIVLKFFHKVDGQHIEMDTLKYINAAGNHYMVNEIQYFISDVILHNSDGSSFLIKAWGDIHYVDTDIPSTWTWNILDSIPAGTYDSISFTFGISEAKNQSYMFVNPPENNMFWPEYLGGGYHYLKLNGKWSDGVSQAMPYEFHLGIGQIYSGTGTSIDSIIGFVQNYFNVDLPNSSFSIAEKETRTIEIEMNVESWFDTPHVWDFNVQGTYIMQNQEAMQIAKENGVDVFSISSIR